MCCACFVLPVNVKRQVRKKFYLYKVFPQVEFLYFLFSSARESDCFILLVLAHKNTDCCVCTAALLAASLTAAHSPYFLSPPMTHNTAQHLHGFVRPRTQGRRINVLVNRRVHDHEIVLRWVRRFAGGVSLQRQG